MAKCIGVAYKEHSEYGHVHQLKKILKKVDIHLVEDDDRIFVFNGKPTKTEIKNAMKEDDKE